MYEFHGWFALSESPDEDADEIGAFDPRVEELRSLLAQFGERHNAKADLHMFNGLYCLNVTGYLNRPGKETEHLEVLLGWLAQHLPGSYGLLYERGDDMPVPPGPHAFRVRVLARGHVVVRLDPFFSPTQPAIEDGPSHRPWVV